MLHNGSLLWRRVINLLTFYSDIKLLYKMDPEFLLVTLNGLNLHLCMTAFKTCHVNK